MEDQDDIEEFMTFMEDNGILEWVGMDESGERTFVFNFDVMYSIMPDLYHVMMEDINNELLHLYQAGFVDIEYDNELSPHFKINDEGRKYLMDHGIPIPEELEDENP